jgi:hypothetical protein
MSMINRYILPSVLMIAGSLVTLDSAVAQTSVNPQDLGIVEAPAAGSITVPLGQVPLPIRHSAQVAFKVFDSNASLTGAQLDKDDVLAVWEVRGVTSDGRQLEADIKPDGTIEELEIEIRQGAVPNEVMQALKTFAPQFVPAADRLIEKSVRPSDVGLSEIWYEFSGANFDVEVRSDGRAALIEPA